VEVNFIGTGLLSGKPYYFGVRGTFNDSRENTSLTLDPAELRNAGAEPVAISEMTIRTDRRGPLNISAIDIQIAQDGNGTNTPWLRGPLIPVDRPRCPASLLGVHAGEALIHRFPGDGILLEPGEGLTPALMSLFTGLNIAMGSRSSSEIRTVKTNFDVGLALSGYLMVT
jgi:hypothetical protein